MSPRNPDEDLPSVESEACDVGTCFAPWAWSPDGEQNGPRELRLCERHASEWLRGSLVLDARVRAVVDRVASETGLRPEVVLGSSRTLSVIAARRRVMASLWLDHGMSHTEVARALGRDHTTVLVAVRKALGPEAYRRALAARRGRAA